MNPAHKWLGRRIIQFTKELRVLVKTWNHNPKPDPILSPPTCPSDHLMKVRCRQISEFASIVTVALHKNNGPGREIHPGCHCGCRKNSLQIPLAHHLFNESLPVRKLSPMMGANPGFQKRSNLAMSLKVREIPQKCAYSLFE